MTPWVGILTYPIFADYCHNIESYIIQNNNIGVSTMTHIENTAITPSTTQKAWVQARKDNDKYNIYSEEDLPTITLDQKAQNILADRITDAQWWTDLCFWVFVKKDKYKIALLNEIIKMTQKNMFSGVAHKQEKISIPEAKESNLDDNKHFKLNNEMLQYTKPTILKMFNINDNYLTPDMEIYFNSDRQIPSNHITTELSNVAAIANAGDHNNNLTDDEDIDNTMKDSPHYDMIIKAIYTSDTNRINQVIVNNMDNLSLLRRILSNELKQQLDNMHKQYSEWFAKTEEEKEIHKLGLNQISANAKEIYVTLHHSVIKPNTLQQLQQLFKCVCPQLIYMNKAYTAEWALFEYTKTHFYADDTNEYCLGAAIQLFGENNVRFANAKQIEYNDDTIIAQILSIDKPQW